jgi:hypothetical protein
MAATLESRTLSVTIDLPCQAVYDFISPPENFPLWASALCQSIRQSNGAWIAETHEGSVTVRFTERNALGVLDHYVIPEPGVEFYIPMRVIANGDSTDLIFTLFRLPEMTAEKFAADTEWVLRDLNVLKSLLERKPQYMGRTKALVRP